MRKPAFCICENEDADQLRGNREADQRLCFRYKDSTIPLLPKSETKPLSIFCGCTARFVLDLARPVFSQRRSYLKSLVSFCGHRLALHLHRLSKAFCFGFLDSLISLGSISKV